MNKLRTKLILCGLLLQALAFTSCTKEERTGCNSGIWLHYEYIKNGTDYFGPDVNRMAIYIFDQNNLFCESMIIDDPTRLGSDNLIKLSLDPGKYTIVSWGGDMTTYDVGEMPDPTTPSTFRRGVLTKGETKLDDFRLMIQYSEGAPNELVAVDDPVDLFYGSLTNVEVKSVSEYAHYTIPMIKNTNTLKVIITGLQYLPTYVIGGGTRAQDPNAPLDVYCTMANGRYKWNNEIGEYARMLKYTPDYTRLSPDKMEVDMKVMRLMKETPAAKPSTLVINDITSGVNLYGKDVINEILSLKDGGGNYIYNSQEDLDREDFFTIEVKINGDLSITVTINGWISSTIEKPFN